MKETKITYKCDVCIKIADYKSLTIQVIFLTDQTEGKPTEPNLHLEKLDLCEICIGKIMKGHYLFAQGAQGYNTYHFRTTENK